MLSKSQISFIKSLHQKKYRKENGIFIIEGIKSITEFINSSYLIDSVFYTAPFLNLLSNLPANIKLFEVNPTELSKITTLQAPQGVLALVKIPKEVKITAKLLENKFSLVLDNLQDPGNLGTIIRTADWFGFKNIICSTNTVELYNPKTVQATMGSLARINVFYTDLSAFLAENKLPVYGALLSGNNIYENIWPKQGLVILGNEGKGITDQLLNKIDFPITIPKFGEAESLNVAISAAIICSEITRNLNK